MQHFQKTSRSVQLTSVLVALGLLLVATSSHAITGNHTWAKVVPGSNTGGAVLWNDSIGWYTDRVSRGEQAMIFCRPSRAGESGWDRGYTTTCGTTRFGPFGPSPLNASYAYGQGYVIPTNPACDNLRIWVKSNFETATLHLPIGTRP